MDQHQSKRSICIRLDRPMRPFLYSSTVADGFSASRRITATPLICSSTRELITLVLDFIAVDAANGDIRPMADQVRRAIAWVFKNAAGFGGDTKRFYVGGHSSGGHLCGVALVTDWQKDFDLPADMVTGGLLMSGIYDLKAPRLSGTRSAYVKFDDDMEQSLSSMRHIDRLRAPITVTYGGFESPEFQRQSRDFASAVKAAGKPVELIEAPSFNHFEMCESLGNPYGPNGLAALKLMKLA
jgi:arylformamidase